MVGRSRTVLTRSPDGLALFPKIGWFLRRARRAPVRRKPRADPTSYRLPEHDERLVRGRYHLRGRQLRRACAEAARRGGDPGEGLVEILERRLDALLWRAGFAPSIRQARRLVAHRHVVVDGRPVGRPSYPVRAGQTIGIRESRIGKASLVSGVQERAGRLAPPPYLELRPDQLQATLTREPSRPELPGLATEPVTVRVVTG
ncbi:30S ribosomal protein S4 [Plantactinospora sp. CA-290183]|uniref:30S ribosomal protein S4 n=1 Tax=Plantactinospora sp. CA-290183 TaxID=3240006 RepID=UPI003D8B2617